MTLGFLGTTIAIIVLAIAAWFLFLAVIEEPPVSPNTTLEVRE